MNQVFNLNRFLLLFIKHWSENRKKYLLGLLALMGIILAWFGFQFLIEPMAPMGTGVQLGTYFVGLFIAGCLYGSTLFADLSSKSRGTNYLSVPASHLEKTICTLLYGVVIFFLFYTLVFYIADIIMVQVGNVVAHHFWTKNHVPGAVFEPQSVINVFWTGKDLQSEGHNVFFYILLGYFALQSAYLLGSVYFSRYSFIKTTVGLLFVCLLIIVFVGKIVGSFMPDGNFYDSLATYRLNNGNDASEKIVRLPEWVNTVSLFLLKYTFPPVFWIATYFRVKEKEL